MLNSKDLLKNVIVAMAANNTTVAESNLRQYILTKSSEFLSEQMGGNNMNPQGDNMNPQGNNMNPQGNELPYPRSPWVLMYKEEDSDYEAELTHGPQIRNFVINWYDGQGQPKFAPAQSGIGVRFDVYRSIDDPESVQEFGGYVFDCDQLARQFPDEVNGVGLLLHITEKGFIKVDPSTISRIDMRDMGSVARRPYNIKASALLISIRKVA